MTENTEMGWFEDVNPTDLVGAREAIEDGSAESPEDWPALAVEAGFADDKDEYYELLREATMSVTWDMVREAEMAEDQQLIHNIRAMDDCKRTANELAERVAEWAGSLFDDTGTGVTYARELAANPPSGAPERLIALAARVDDLADESDNLRRYVERVAPNVAPNLEAMAGPLLAARLIALAGGLKQLARMPSGTVQVLGAEDALFAHLRGHAPPPKHGVIYTHNYVHGTRPQDRGSAARAVAGKLTIAARVDHYSGTRKPELERELDERIAAIRAREGGDE